MRFSDIPGHLGVKQHLRRLADDDMLPHALLLSGVEGSGKLALARALAQYVQCESPVNGDSCGHCASCRQHESHNAADMHFVFPIVKSQSKGQLVSNDLITQWRTFLDDYPFAGWQNWLTVMDAGNSRPAIYVRESADILRMMNLSNFSAKYKILIMWLPEKMQAEAANKLLKIIEEPFADTRFIFVSNNPAEIMPTIYSRLQRVEVPRFSDDDLIHLLVEQKGVDEESAINIASLSEGNACAAFEAVSAAGEFNEFMLTFQQIMRNLYSRNVKALLKQSDEIAMMGREKSIRFLAYCTRMMRENFIYNLGVPSLTRLSKSEEQFASRFAPFITAANVEQMTAEFDSASADIGRNANAKIVMFDSLLRLTAFMNKR